MVQIHMTEAEAACNFHAVIAYVREGAEVIIEQNHLPVAVIRTPRAPGRSITECISLAKAYEARLGYPPIPDEDFAKDVQEAIDAHREPFEPPPWD